MRVVCLYREEKDYTREVEEYLEEINRKFNEAKVEILNPDTEDGDDFATLYGILEYPSIVAIDDEGKVLQTWKGMPLPRMDEIVYYLKDM